MDLELLSDILIELIPDHDRISLPGLGSFITEISPSVFSDGGMVIHPPVRKVFFRVSESWNDGILERKYAEAKGISLDESTVLFEKFAGKLKTELHSKKNFHIPDFGILRATNQDDYFFVADKNLFTYPEAFGLEPLNIKILFKPGIIEQLEEGPCTGMSEKAGEGTAALNTGKVLELEYDKPALDESNSDNSNIIIEDDITEIIKSENKSSGKETIIMLFVIITVLTVIILLLGIMFKDELRPFWEWLLYSKEERELLKSICRL